MSNLKCGLWSALNLELDEFSVHVTFGSHNQELTTPALRPMIGQKGLVSRENEPKNIFFYYINTNEIPSELSRENMISSHVKRSLLLWLHIKIAPFDAFCEMI